MRRIAATGLVVLAALAGARGANAAEQTGRISVSGAWALYPMAVRWGDEFRKVHPGVRFDISAGGAGKGMTDVLAGMVDIGLVSREVAPAEIEKGVLPIPVTKDAVVPVVNARNPVLAALLRQGVKREVLQGIWITGTVTNWGQIAGDRRLPMRVYTRSDACGAAETWAGYLGGKQEDLKGIGIYGDPGLAEAVRRDLSGIGYNNVNFAYDRKTGKPIAGLEVLPLDVNADGALGTNEEFYATQKDLMSAVARGDYPSPPARDLFFVTKGRPARPVVLAFIEWVLGDGQKFVEDAGYIRLPEDRMKAELRKLRDGGGNQAPPAEKVGSEKR